MKIADLALMKVRAVLVENSAAGAGFILYAPEKLNDTSFDTMQLGREAHTLEYQSGTILLLTYSNIEELAPCPAA